MNKEDYEALENYYKLVCEDISRQRARVGGDWVVAGVVVQKHQRDLIRSEHISLSRFGHCHCHCHCFIRKLLGPDLVIVILTMPREKIRKRLKERHPKKEDKKLIDILMVILRLCIHLRKHSIYNFVFS